MSLLERLLVLPINHLLVDSPWATERLRQHAGARVAIHGGALALLLQIDHSGLLRACNNEVNSTAAEVRIDLPADFMLKAAVDRNNLLASARLSGMADIAETLAFVSRNLRWDAEGDLARLVGDIPARRLTLAGSSLLASVQESARRLGENLREYATEECELLANPRQVQAFSAEVSVLRDDLARLEKRLDRLI